MNNLINNLSVALFIIIFLVSCVGDPKTSELVMETIEEIDPMKDKGVGPIIAVDITGAINQSMADQGEVIFNSICSACHKLDQKFIGPALIGVTKRRTPEWIMNMIMNPEQMVKKNAQARRLRMEYASPMVNQGLTEAETRSILEYFRINDIEL